MEDAYAQTFSEVRIHESSVASDLGARAFTSGEDIVFAPGTLDLDSDEGRRLLGHELTHVVQQRQGRVEEPQAEGGFINADPALEAEADAMGDLVARHQRVGAAGLACSRSVTDSARAHADAGPVQRKAAPDESALSAGDYLERHLAMFAEWVPWRLGQLGQPPLPSYASWSIDPQAFALRLGSVIESAGTRLALARAVAPASLTELIDRGRHSIEDPYMRQRGPGRWYPAVAGEVANALYHNLHRCVARVTERYARASLRAGQATAAEGADREDVPVTEPAAGDIVPAHPLDRFLAEVLCLGGVVSLKPEAARSALGTAAGIGELRPVRYQPLGQAAWNWITAIEPMDATVEEVAAALFGNPDQAYRLTAAPPLFGLQAADALEIPELAALKERQSVLDGTAVLPFDYVGAEVAADPAATLAGAGYAETLGMAMAGTPGDSVTADQAFDAINRCRGQMQIIQELAAPFDQSGLLDTAAGRLDSRLGRLADVDTATAKQWAHHAGQQTEILGRIITGLSAVRDRLGELQVDDQAELALSAPDVREPLVETAAAFVSAAAQIDLPPLARTRCDEAETQARLAPLYALERLLGSVQDRIEEMSRSADQPDADFIGKAFRPGFFRNPQESLHMQVGELRARVLAGDDIDGALAQVAGEIQRLSFEMDLAATLTRFSEVVSALGDNTFGFWNTVTLSADDLHDRYVEGAGFKADLQRIYRRWNQTSEQLGKAETPADKAAIEAALIEIQDQLYSLGQNEEFASFLRRAYREIEDAGTKVAIAQVAVMVGITLASMGAGSVVAGAAGGARLGASAQFLAQAATEAAVFTALDVAVFQSDSWVSQLVQDMGTNLATFGLVRAWQRGSRLMKIGRAMEDSGEAVSLAQYAQRLGAHAADMSVQGLIIAGTQYAGVQAAQLAKEGRSLTAEEQVELGKQGLAMFIGMGVLGRAARPIFDRIQGSGYVMVARQRAIALRKRTVRIGKEVEVTRDPDRARELLAIEREALAAETQLIKALEADPRAMADSRLSEDQLASWSSEVDSGIHRTEETDVFLALEHVSSADGRAFECARADVEHTLAVFHRAGAEVEAVTVDELTGARRFRLKDADGETYHLVERAEALRDDPSRPPTPEEAAALNAQAERVIAQQEARSEEVAALMSGVEHPYVRQVTVGAGLAGILSHGTTPWKRARHGIAGEPLHTVPESLVISEDFDWWTVLEAWPIGQSVTDYHSPARTHQAGDFNPDHAGKARASDLANSNAMTAYANAMPVYKRRVTEVEMFDGSTEWPVKTTWRLKAGDQWVYTDHVNWAGGLGVPRKHRAFGEDLENQLRAAGKLTDAQDPKRPLVPDISGGTIAVIGGGPTAGWAAVKAAQNGNRARLIMRPSDSVESLPPELQASLTDHGVEVVTGDVVQTSAADGRVRLELNDGNTLHVDGVSLAIGQTFAPPEGFDKLVFRPKRREVNGQQLIVAWEAFDPATGQATGMEVRGANMGKIPAEQIRDPNDPRDPDAGQKLLAKYRDQRTQTGASAESAITEAAIYHHQRYIEANRD